MVVGSQAVQQRWLGSPHDGVHRAPGGVHRDLWMAMAGHPFVLGLADGTLPDGALQAWVQQDRIFVVEERGSWPRSAPTACRRGWARCSPIRLPALTVPALSACRWSAAGLRRLGFRFAQVDVVAFA